MRHRLRNWLRAWLGVPDISALERHVVWATQRDAEWVERWMTLCATQSAFDVRLDALTPTTTTTIECRPTRLSDPHLGVY